MNVSPPGDIFQGMVSLGGYVTVPSLASLLNVSERAVRAGIERGKYTALKQVTGIVGRGGKAWLIHIGDPAIPERIKLAYYETIAFSPHAAGDKAPGPAASMSREQAALGLAPAPYSEGQKKNTETAQPPVLSNEEIDAEIYSSAPLWARKKADKYLVILKEAGELKGSALKDLVAAWNAKHPEFKTSYDSILDARKEYAENGISGLLGKYGKNSGKTKITDKYYDYYRKEYLKEGAPSVRSCWVMTLGYARTLEPKLEVAGFPSPAAFSRKLEREIPEDAVFLARYGKEAWKRKYSDFINRDYSKIECGECAVSDHAQVDIAVKLPNGKAVFPWVTAWRDFKSSKWLGWMHHPEAPNSDHIFQSFYYAVDQWGLFSDALIDNGKDYKARDFAGGRRYHKVSIDEPRTAPMLLQVGITPHFALPYNAQTKPIERDFLKWKELLSKHMIGYRGGDVTERPEKLKQEIKSGSILSWDEYTKLMDTFIINVLNQMPSEGKVLKGRSPDELWQQERIEQKRISKDALKLFCMRTSEEISIGRNGIKESSLESYYWAEWMTGRKGIKVYMRRDPKAWQQAWVFDATTHEYLGRAELATAVPALARTDIEREQVRSAITANKQRAKIAKAFIEIKDAPSPAELVTHMVAGVKALNELRGYEPQVRKEVKIIGIGRTAMDEVIQKEAETLKEGTYDISLIRPQERRTRKIKLFQCE